VEPVDPALEVEVDVPLLASALSNLLQNAFKYTRERGTVSLRTLGAAGRVVFQVEDECGGMPAPVGDDPLRAGVAPRGDGRSGLGLGLSISRRATEAIGGQIRTRNLPGRGCIFEVELPLAAPAP
jgi:signal transduction histidine kinase